MKGIDAELRRRFEKRQNRNQERIKEAVEMAILTHKTVHCKILWGPVPAMYGIETCKPERNRT